MNHPDNLASVEWHIATDLLHDRLRIWKGYNDNGEMIDRREFDTDKGMRQEIAALYDMGWKHC